jgi:hypothetical protein
MLKAFTCFTFALFLCAAPVFANVTVTTPASGAEVVSPFSLIAKATACSGQRIDAMGYSLDDSTNTTIIDATSINTKVSGMLGAHILHVKSWGHRGSSCVTNVAIDIVADPAPAPTNPIPVVPTDAIAFSAVQSLTTWQAMNDTGSGGSSSGAMTMVSSPSLSGSARKFATQFTNYGGELYYTVIGSNTNVSNFLYDGWVYIANSASNIGNIEMDLNQVMANGQTVIYGFQCDGWTGTWDYTENAGTPNNPVDEWVHSQAPCNPQNWSVNTWHHVQITYNRDQYGNVTYQSVWLDGVEQDLNGTVPSAFALGWSSVLLTNFQIDGYTTSGSSTEYVDKLTVYAW